MAVRHLGDDGRGVDPLPSTQRDQESARAGQPHQAADVVRHQHVVGAGRHQVVPRRAGPRSPRQHRGVGVQLRMVRRVRNGAEHCALGGGRCRQHQQRLIRVGRDDGRVEQTWRGVAGGDQHAIGHPRNRANRHSGHDFVQPDRDGLDVGRGPADHGAPRRRPEHRKHAVVLQEDEQVARGVAHRLTWRAGPYRGHQRREEALHEVVGEAVPCDERAERFEVGASSRSSASNCVATRWKRLTSSSIRRYRGRARLDGAGNSPPRPRAPAYSSPIESSRTDSDMSVSCVAMPSSENNQQSVG